MSGRCESDRRQTNRGCGLGVSKSPASIKKEFSTFGLSMPMSWSKLITNSKDVRWLCQIAFCGECELCNARALASQYIRWLALPRHRKYSGHLSRYIFRCKETTTLELVNNTLTVTLTLMWRVIFHDHVMCFLMLDQLTEEVL